MWHCIPWNKWKNVAVVKGKNEFFCYYLNSVKNYDVTEKMFLLYLKKLYRVLSRTVHTQKNYWQQNSNFQFFLLTKCKKLLKLYLKKIILILFSLIVYVIHWQGLRIPVFRPNVECTNGIIHVIDRPFLQKGDIRVSSAHTFKASIVLYIIAFLLVKF